MEKHTLKIINFLHLDKIKYHTILEYRNQPYIRKVSQNEKVITPQEHQKYLKLLQQQDKYFAFLITKNEEDYGVVTLQKITDDTYTIGDYLVKELFQFEGGGVVNRICISFIATKLKIKYLQTTQKKNNTRSNRAGGVKTFKITSIDEHFNEVIATVDDFYSLETINSKPRRLFDKLYTISDFIL